MANSFFWVGYKILLCWLVPTSMWFVQLFTDKRQKKSKYYRRRAFAYSVLFFLVFDFLPLIFKSFNSFDNPYESRIYAISAIPWLIFILIGFRDGDVSNRGFLYSLWEPFVEPRIINKNNYIKTGEEFPSNPKDNQYENKAKQKIKTNNHKKEKKRGLGKSNSEEYDAELSSTEMGRKTLKTVEYILSESFSQNFSDIHIEPKENDYKIRVRNDGLLQKLLTISSLEGQQLIACLKSMADMDVAEKRSSQDGKIIKVANNEKLEFRCSTVPGRIGESMVLRLLKSHSSLLDLDVLINIESVRKSFRKIIGLQNGIVIVSGPTGSGKSTTLAAALKEIDNGKMKIVTVEDPIEFDLGGDIVQSQVNRAKGQTFPTLLRTFMRHDPDIILIGETRDPETAISSMDASETGHLVFTTMHANSAASSLSRLLDMEVPKYKLNVSVRAVLAQRLIRSVCPFCSIDSIIKEEDHKKTGIRSDLSIKYANVLSEHQIVKHKKENKLCENCKGLGYKGRLGIYELLIINRNIQDAISNGKSDLEIQDLAIAGGMMTLREYGIRLVIDNLTTVSELERVCKIA